MTDPIAEPPRGAASPPDEPPAAPTAEPPTAELPVTGRATGEPATAEPPTAEPPRTDPWPGGGAAGSAAPPPQAGGFATRFNLVRPREGRYIAGVCAAIGRATNTDPVLWRVILAVLAIVGGSGLIIYLLGVLLIPKEGDTGSPLEGLLGRGRSSTSVVRTVLIVIVLAIAFFASISHNFPVALLVAALVVAVALLVAQADRGAPPLSSAPLPPPAGPSTASAMMTATPMPAESAVRQPFAPYGPYAPTPVAGAVVAPPVAPLPPRPRPPRSRLGRITLSIGLLALGVLTAFDLAAGVRVPFPAYVAVALGTVGLGLLVGAWFGRARGLIALGLVLCVGLAGATAAESLRGIKGGIGKATWPIAGEELQPRYELAIGDATLDLTGIDFTGQDRTIVIQQGIGSTKVLLPPTVDTTAEFNVNVGKVTAFGTSWDAHAQPHRVVVDKGADGDGGGQLHLIINLKVGDVEVHR